MALIQCYFNKGKIDNSGKSLQCENETTDIWCSEEHKQLWQSEEYGITETRREKLTINEIQKRLLQMSHPKKLL